MWGANPHPHFELIGFDFPAGKLNAPVAELADALDLGSNTIKVCGFESRRVYHQEDSRIYDIN